MSSFLDETTTKALIAASIGAGIDLIIYKNNNIKATMLLAGCIGGSSFLASKLSKSLPDLSYGAIPASSMYDVRTIEQRILELSLSSGSSFVLSKYVFKNMRELPMIQYVAIFAGSSIGAEYISDYVYRQKLSYLS